MSVFAFPLARAALGLGAAILLAAAAPQQPTPSDLYGPLFEAVQTSRALGDGKTFVDAVPRVAPEQIMADYARERPSGSEALRRFVEARFDVPGAEPAPDLPITDGAPLDQHIAELWPVLTRPPLDPPAGSSALPMPAPYVVPGGRFREIYYWDTYFTMLGLKADGQDALLEGMLTNFEAMLQAYGRIPNGARSYYLSRSQPPFYALMVGLSDRTDTQTRRRRLEALRTEHAFWMDGVSCVGEEGACLRVVRMPDGAYLNRYWDDRDAPRDESWAEDVETAERAPGRPAEEVYRELRAGAESGWDFSSRWLDEPMALSTIRTTQTVPVDLNSLLWSLEREIAAQCRALMEAVCVDSFEAQAAARRAAILNHLWDAEAGRFGDWDRRAGALTPTVSAALLCPLFVGLATPEQARAMADVVRDQLLASGGLRTTTVETGQQWDRPNGWAPLQWIAVVGLERYGEDALARDIATRWLTTVERVYRETGKMLEKYDVEQARPGGGGEYPLQDGFGWTNGVTRALLDAYRDAPDEAGRILEDNRP